MLPYSSKNFAMLEGRGLLASSSEVECLCRTGRETTDDLFAPGSVDAVLLVPLPVGRLKRSSLTSVAALDGFSRTCLHCRTLVHQVVSGSINAYEPSMTCQPCQSKTRIFLPKDCGMYSLCSFYPPELLVQLASFVDSAAQKSAVFAARRSMKESCDVHRSDRRTLIHPCRAFDEMCYQDRKIGSVRVRPYRHSLGR